MTIQATASQLSNSTTQVIWATDEADPAAGWEIFRKDDAAAPVTLGTLGAGASRTFFDAATPAAGTVVIYTVQDLTTTTTGDAPAITIVDLDVDFTYGELDPLAAAPRYTSLAAVYQVIGQGLAEGQDLDRDARLTEAIIACEFSIDSELGRSFPDEGTNPEIVGIPEAIKSVARSAAVSVYQSSAAPFGTSGADDFLGTISVAAVVADSIRRNPLLMHFKVSFGVA